ncbi:hypothetical protein HRR83_000756 [Exophiala dermatitidis]|nr:hypothetical protein HRR74_000760 [Exophiala dermatitidis]KAJ4528638.1 hypothetical protein HRR73_001261 [Exophiala dermatitidis]KAJ4530015.1 hypothetical protein HRR76_009257 [Exophiala dermatitidis]KAJ4558778.1 hypothetical protein HRR77_000758 [Exophiala dermatitidis]KAJ4581193.1 hypothetical protein HRR79_000240 [Exophiala dermatitidis]
MAVDTLDPILSMTPPCSDLDEFEKSALLTCSPSLTGFNYPSPTPSHQGHRPSVSSDCTLNIRPADTMASRHPSHDLHSLSFDDASSDSASFFPVPAVTDPSLTSYPATTSSTTAYTMYEQNQWFGYSNYSQPVPLMQYDPISSTSFNSYPQSATQHSLTNIIPPTPQDIQPSPFDFNTAPRTIPSNHNLVASPSFSQISSHSHRSSARTMSRSCSPVPSLNDAFSRGHSGEPTTLRPPLRSASSSSSSSLHAYGIPVIESSSAMPGNSFPSSSPTSNMANGAHGIQAWRCAFPGCTSRATFTRGCDLRKHYNRHSKHLFCRVEGCPQSEAAAVARAKANDQPLAGGFSSKKDRARHEAKHNPGIKCEWRGPDGEECTRVFSRMDNMKDHVRRIHHKTAQLQQHHRLTQNPTLSSS